MEPKQKRYVQREGEVPHDYSRAKEKFLEIWKERTIVWIHATYSLSQPHPDSVPENEEERLYDVLIQGREAFGSATYVTPAKRSVTLDFARQWCEGFNAISGTTAEQYCEKCTKIDRDNERAAEKTVTHQRETEGRHKQAAEYGYLFLSACILLGFALLAIHGCLTGQEIDDSPRFDYFPLHTPPF
ncbi:MAG TPA: hypothetical protein VMY42_15525 [Thermoguttaceae bacterium]|nr:hypothetical protein [Thermoguttaceae bacterium]